MTVIMIIIGSIFRVMSLCERSELAIFAKISKVSQRVKLPHKKI